MNEILTLDKDITLFINGSNSLMWDRAIYMATQTVTWIPLGMLLLFIVYRNGGMKNLLMVLGMILVGIFISDQLSSSLSKPLVHRFRPTQDPQIMYLVDIVNDYRGGRFGFFSAHASNTFTVATFLSLLFRHRMATILLMSWSTLNCYTRMYLGVHYMGDILVGTLVGLTLGFCLYKFYIRKMPAYAVTLEPEAGKTPSGFNLNHMYIFAACILLTYCSLFIIPQF